MARAAAKPVKALAYPIARAFVVVGSAALFFFIAAVLGGALASALSRDTLQPEHAAWLLGIGLLCSAFFAGQGGSIGLLDAFSQGRVALPAAPSSPPSAAGACNPWAVALRCAGAFGLPIGALGFGAIYLFWPGGLAREPFAWLFALTSAALGGGIVAALSGRPFLREAGLPAAQRVFQGSHAAYLWQRHVVPQAAINLFINAWVGVAIAPVRFGDADPRVARDWVLADARGSAFVLAIAIAIGVHVYARFDLRWGVVAGSVGKAPHAALQIGALIGSALLVALSVHALFALTGWDTIGLGSFVLWRSLAAGAYCGLVAYYIARWNQLRPVPEGETLTPQAGRAAT